MSGSGTRPARCRRRERGGRPGSGACAQPGTRGRRVYFQFAAPRRLGVRVSPTPLRGRVGARPGDGSLPECAFEFPRETPGREQPVRAWTASQAAGRTGETSAGGNTWLRGQRRPRLRVRPSGSGGDPVPTLSLGRTAEPSGHGPGPAARERGARAGPAGRRQAGREGCPGTGLNLIKLSEWKGKRKCQGLSNIRFWLTFNPSAPTHLNINGLKNPVRRRLFYYFLIRFTEVTSKY